MFSISYGKKKLGTYYRFGWLIDGSGVPAFKNVIVHIKNIYFHDIIYDVYDIEKNIKLIDMSEYTIFPTFVDVHTHLAFSGENKYIIKEKKPKSKEDIIHSNVKKHLSFGVAVVRDAGDSNNDVLRYKHNFFNYKKYPINIFSSGKAWHFEGRYGKFIGTSVSTSDRLSKLVYLEAPYRDHIKLINSGLNSLVQFGLQSLPQFELFELKLAVKVASRLGKKVMVHANGVRPVEEAIKAGCHSIEHGYFMGKSNFELMVKNSTFWVPTIFTMKSFINNFKKNRRMIGNLEIISKNLEHQLKQVELAKKTGVVIALGTDAGSPGIDHGSSIKKELELLIEAGYTIEESIKCATINGARLVGLFDIGLIAKGMKANFIAIKSDPSKILQRLNQLDFIFIGGKEL